MYKLEDWSVSPVHSDYASPDYTELYLRGTVFDHPDLNDGTLIGTTKIIGVEGNTVRTTGGSVYKLGNPGAGYFQWCEKHKVAVRLKDTKQPNDNDALFEAALEAGAHEFAEDRKVMLVIPNSKWTSNGTWQRIRGVWVRASTNGPGLQYVPLDTLILVGQSHHTWNKRGERLARGWLRTSLSPRIITFDYPTGEFDGYEDSQT